jgi:hypothetical protein
MSDATADTTYPVTPVAAPDPDLDQVKTALATVASQVKVAFVKDVLAAIADLAKDV